MSAAAESKVTWPEAALINLACALFVLPFPLSDDVELYIDRIRVVLPLVPRDRVLTRDLAVACEDMLRAKAVCHDPDPAVRRPWLRARHEAQEAAHAVLRWRAAQALEKIDELRAPLAAGVAP